MKTIEFNSSYGNFAYRITAEVGEDVNAATLGLCKQGLANVAYRVCGSAVDKALGVKDRKGVEYSEEDAERINAAVSKKIVELECKAENGLDKGLKVSFAVTGQHVFGEASDAPSKEATTLWEQVQAVKDPEKFKTMLGNLGLDEDYDDEKGILACKKHIQKTKAEAKAAAMAKLGLPIGG